MCGLIGIFEHDWGYDWLDCLDEYEVKEAKYFVCESTKTYHESKKSMNYDDMTGYVDTIQNEYDLNDRELYVVCYFWTDDPCCLYQKVDFGITKDEIIQNVLDQKYREGASYHTMGEVFYWTRKMMEDSWDYYEVEFGILADGAQTGDYESPYSMCIKARHWLSLEEAEKYLADDMKAYGCDCVHSVTKISEKEMIGCFDLSDVDNWPIWG